MENNNLPQTFNELIDKVYSLKKRNNDSKLYFDCLNSPFNRGIRANSLKISDEKEFFNVMNKIHEDFKSEQTFEKIKWSDDGYYIDADFFPAKHPLYNAGLFYLQEPSAMLPANSLEAKPGDLVLDICAAPGGKSLKIAADMKGEGLLYSNDISSERIKPLIRNIELMGCSNCIVLNETPNNLSKNFKEYFDKIIIDAPCSGEGMIRKDPNAIKSWEKYGPKTCIVMQRDILENAHSMLKKGGEMLYSTCTFNLEENEKMILEFMGKHPSEYEVMRIEKYDELIMENTLSEGLIDTNNLQNSLRIFPTDARGEGHFCVKLKKIEDEDLYNGNYEKNKDLSLNKKYNSNRPKTQEFTFEDFESSFKSFAKELFFDSFVEKILDKNSHFSIFKGHVYRLPRESADLGGLKVIKQGLYLGNLKKTKREIIFIPSHSFALFTKKMDYLKYISFDTKNIYLQKYLKGETINLKEIDNQNVFGNVSVGGYCPILVLDYILGWSKVSCDQNIKNLYPAGWVRSNELL